MAADVMELRRDTAGLYFAPTTATRWSLRDGQKHKHERNSSHVNCGGYEVSWRTSDRFFYRDNFGIGLRCNQRLGGTAWPLNADAHDFRLSAEAEGHAFVAGRCEAGA